MYFQNKMSFFEHNSIYYGVLLDQERMMELLERDYGIVFENKSDKFDVGEQIEEMRGRNFGPNDCRIYSLHRHELKANEVRYIFGKIINVNNVDTYEASLEWISLRIGQYVDYLKEKWVGSCDNTVYVFADVN